jgi:hypothetical protein
VAVGTGGGAARGVTVGGGCEVTAGCHPERRRSRREGSWVQVNGKTPRGARKGGFLATLGMTGCGAVCGRAGFLATLGMTGCGAVCGRAGFLAALGMTGCGAVRGMTVGGGCEVTAGCHPERRRSRREGSWVQVNGKTPRGAQQGGFLATLGMTRCGAARGRAGFLATLGMTRCGAARRRGDSSLRSE